MKNNGFNICYSADNNYIEQLCVSIVSILKNSAENETFNFYILNSGINKQNKQKIETLKTIKDFNLEFITVNPEEFKNCKLLSEKEMTHYHVTLPTYFRYKIGSIFKNISKILYIDCDIIVKKPLSPLFKVDLKDNFFAMVPDAESKKEAERLGLKKYYNAGVMLINLDLWRSEDLETKLFEYSKKNKKRILWQDQDVINIVCANKIKELKNDWNFQFFLYDFESYSELVKKLKDVSVLHLAGRFKPWIEPFEHPVFEEYYYYLGFTPWANKIQEYKYRCFGKYLEGNTGGAEKFVVSKEELLQKGLKPLYSMIDEAYDFTKKEIAVQKEDFDNKINKVYSEISDNYEFTKSEIEKKNNEIRSELKDNITQETDSKINDVYSEITNNYEFTKSEINKKADEIKDNITQETDSKINDVYSEITNNYEFTKSEINKKADEVRTELKDNITQETDSKINDVYSEITNNYEFTKTEINKKADEIKDNITQETDSKINDVYSEITNNYEFTKSEINKKADEIKDNITQETDSKINDVYSEISNNYEFTKSEIEKKNNETRSELKDNITQETDSKINDVYSEITNNYEFTKSEINKKADEVKDNITQETDSKINDVYSEITNNYEFTKSEINKKADEVKDSLTKESDKKIESVNDTIKALSHRANELVENQKHQTENKIDEIYSQMENDYELLKKQIQGTHENLNHEIQENVNRLEEMSLSNFDEAKAGFIKLIKQLSNNNDKFFEVLNDYHETQERRLIQRLNDVKTEIVENIITSKYEELRDIVREEMAAVKEAEMKTIREYTDSEINNSRLLVSQAIEQMKKEAAVKDRSRQLDFEKQLLDMEMKYKSLKNVLTPVISVMKHFKKTKKQVTSPDERKK